MHPVYKLNHTKLCDIKDELCVWSNIKVIKSGNKEQIFANSLQELQHGHTYYAEDYKTELEKWVDQDFYRKNVHKFQLPFTPVSKTMLRYLYSCTFVWMG